MAVKSPIPKTNIIIDDIRDTLNAYGGNVDDNWLEYFTTKANINPWSKHKPVDYTGDFCQDFDSSRPDYVPNWWKGSGFCGFSVPVHTTYTSAINALNGGMNGWTYQLPQLKFRMGDFAGYYPDAKPMMRDFAVPNNVSSNDETMTGTAFLHTDLSDTELSFADFTTLGNCYFGMLITNGTTTKRATSTYTIGNGGSIVYIKSKGLTTGSWTAAPFLSSKQITEDGADPSSAMYYTIPNLNKVSFNVVSTLMSIALTARKTSEWVDGTPWFGVRYTVKLTSYYTGQRVLENNKLYIKYSSKSFNDPVALDEIEISLADVTIQGGASLTAFEAFAPIENLTLYNDCKVWISLNNGEFSQGILPMSESTGGGTIS